VIVGPSGAGKTTLLRAISGLQALDQGRIDLGGKRIDRLPAHKRRCAVVFQEPRLLAHLDLLDNVGIGLVARGIPRRERRLRAAGLTDEVGLGEFAGGGVKGLSGGEQQRVALARALCAEPDLLLLDEPLSAVDPNRRSSLMELILKLQSDRQVTTISVTHDRAEASEMGQRIALMIDGRVLQSSEPEALFERPETERAARFFGMNVIRGEVGGGRLRLADSEIPVSGPDGEAVFAIRPESVLLRSGVGPEMTVVESVYLGSYVRLRLRAGRTEIESHVRPEEAPASGATVRVNLPEPRLWRIPER